MERGLAVALSPPEETTLYRIARGLADPATHREQDVDRLVLLRLVVLTAAGCSLTALGEQRTRKATEREPVAPNGQIASPG